MTRSLLARFATGATIGALALAPLGALSQAAPEAPDAPPPGFAMADTDGDGTISPAEWAAMTERMGPRLRGAPDGPRGPDHAERAAAMVQLFDQDGDNSLTAEEIAAGSAAMALLRGPGGDGRHGMREGERGRDGGGDRSGMRDGGMRDSDGRGGYMRGGDRDGRGPGRQ
jgi:hypothetical protein